MFYVYVLCFKFYPFVVICNKATYMYRQTQLMFIIYFIVATCFDVIRSSLGH